MANMFNWKLHTPMDYISFLLILLSGVLALFIYLKIIERGRSQKGATKRVRKKLKSHCIPGGVALNNVNIEADGEVIHFDHLIIDQKGILAIKVFNWGTTVFGEPRSEQWKIKDNKKEEVVENPILKMEHFEEKLIKLLSTHDIYNIPIENIAIMADTFEKPLIFLGKKPPAITYKDIKPYLKKRIDLPNKIKDTKKLTDLMTKLCATTKTTTAK